MATCPQDGRHTIRYNTITWPAFLSSVWQSSAVHGTQRHHARPQHLVHSNVHPVNAKVPAGLVVAGHVLEQGIKLLGHTDDPIKRKQSRETGAALLIIESICSR